MGFIFLAASLVFAGESGEGKSSDGASPSISLGLNGDGAFGLWSAKLDKEHFTSPQFGFGISGLFSYGHFGVRLSALGKYQAVYVSEGTRATVNEGFWRLGGGGAFRIQNSPKEGAWAELGAAALFPLQRRITLCESEEQGLRWDLESNVEIPVELSAGYRFPLKAVSLDVSLFGAYDLNEPLSLRANERNIHAKAWNVGGRIALWGGSFL